MQGMGCQVNFKFKDEKKFFLQQVYFRYQQDTHTQYVCYLSLILGFGGRPGYPGFDGPAGATGDRGAEGTKGEAGEAVFGTPGSRGRRGDIGDPGPQGKSIQELSSFDKKNTLL